MRDLTGRLDLLSLNAATVRERWRLAEIIDGCARHGFGGIAPWRDQLLAMGVAAGAGRIRDAGLQVSGYCRGGMFTAADESARRTAIEDNLEAIDEAVAIGASCLVVVAGGLAGGSKDLPGAWRQIEDGLAAVLPHARAAGIPLAIEPLHPMYAADRCSVNTLGHALDMCERLDPPATHAARSGERPPIGVAIDVYHVWWDPDLADQVARAGASKRILAFHVCDWRVPTRDLLLDRGMMGDGAIDIRRIRGLVESAGFDGQVEVEIFSQTDWWRRDPDEVLEVVADRFQTIV